MQWLSCFSQILLNQAKTIFFTLITNMKSVFGKKIWFSWNTKISLFRLHQADWKKVLFFIFSNFCREFEALHEQVIEERLRSRKEPQKAERSWKQPDCSHAIHFWNCFFGFFSTWTILERPIQKLLRSSQAWKGSRSPPWEKNEKKNFWRFFFTFELFGIFRMIWFSIYPSIVKGMKSHS